MATLTLAACTDEAPATGETDASGASDDASDTGDTSDTDNTGETDEPDEPLPDPPPVAPFAEPLPLDGPTWILGTVYDEADPVRAAIDNGSFELP